MLTSASSSSLSELVKSESTRNQHSKRQYIEEEYPSPADAIDAIPAEVMDSIPKVYDGMTTTYEAEETGSEWGSANEASRVASSPFTVLADNSTSIFLPKENSGLFNRYIFFSSPLIFGECKQGVSCGRVDADLHCAPTSHHHRRPLYGPSVNLDLASAHYCRDRARSRNQDDWSCRHRRSQERLSRRSLLGCSRYAYICKICYTQNRGPCSEIRYG